MSGTMLRAIFPTFEELEELVSEASVLRAEGRLLQGTFEGPFVVRQEQGRLLLQCRGLMAVSLADVPIFRELRSVTLRVGMFSREDGRLSVDLVDYAPEETSAPSDVTADTLLTARLIKCPTFRVQVYSAETEAEGKGFESETDPSDPSPYEPLDRSPERARQSGIHARARRAHGVGSYSLGPRRPEYVTLTGRSKY